MQRKRRFHIRKPHIRLYDTTGLSQDVQHGLRMAIFGVTLAMVFSVITTGAAWTGFLRLLGADSMTLGIISAIPVAVSTLQIFASYLMERLRARRGLFLVFGLIARASWIAIGLLPVFIPQETGMLRLYALMALLALSSGSSSFVNLGFYSLMADIVPLRIRGRYFSARQAVSLVSGILTGLFVSFMMDSMSGMTGYTIILVIAGIFGLLDILCFLFIKWPPMQKKTDEKESIARMIGGVIRDRPYMRIVGYFTLWLFAVNISGPFLNVYFLEYVQMSFTEITLVNQIIPNVATMFAIGWWGRKTDQYGNQPVVQTVGFYCMLLVLLYTFTGPRSFAILPFAHVLSGMSWPASDLGQQNMYLAKAPAENRSMYVAVFFACTQLFGTALSNFVGGVLMSGPLKGLEALGLSWFGFSMTRYHYLFIIGFLLRASCVLIFLPRLREETDVPARQMVREIAGQAFSRLRAVRRALHEKRVRSKYHKDNQQREDIK